MIEMFFAGLYAILSFSADLLLRGIVWFFAWMILMIIVRAVAMTTVTSLGSAVRADPLQSLPIISLLSRYIAAAGWI